MRRRLSPQEQDTSRREFFRRAACAALGMTAMYSTIRDLRLINAAAADGLPAGATDYKAIICLFLFGGNDSNNLLVPTEDTSTGYQAYASARKGLAIPAASLLPLNPLTNDGHTYGVHPECVEIAGLFNSGKLAFLANVGSLVYPITRAQYKASPRVIPVPPQLFSHNDQVVQWQTSIPNQDVRAGWGGRVADLVNSMNGNASNGQPVSMNISLSGVNIFEVGNLVNQYNCGTSGPIGLSTGSATGLTAATVASTNATLTNINNIPLQPALPGAPQLNLYEKADADMNKRALDNFAAINTAIAATAAANYFTTPFTFNYPRGSATFPGSSLMNQLKMVARLIAGRGTLGHKRQIFFVSVGGYDLHDSQVTVTDPLNPLGTNPMVGSHAKLFSEISQALGVFNAAINQLRANGNLAAADSVALYTASDFSRTFPMNGGFGSDHAWGSHHMVFGDQVIGQKIYGTYPVLQVNGPDDTDTGRWIPRTSVDEYSATLAKWFGVSVSNLNTVFPNLSHFSNPDLGFMAPASAAAAPLSVASAEVIAPAKSTPKTPTKPTTVKKPTLRKPS